MISVEEGLRILDGISSPLETESCPLAEADGRVSARDIVSDVDWPPFDTSAMDGWAVRVEDVAKSAIGLAERASVVAAGDAACAPLSEMEAARVMTGSPIPAGTQAVVPFEDGERRDGLVIFGGPPVSGAHIRRRGESIASGAVLLCAGQRLSAQGIALAALAGAARIEVHRRPRVTVVATGNELVDSDREPGPGKLRDSNGPMLASLCRRRGWPVIVGERVADDAGAAKRLFGQAGSREDVLVTSGGVSAGDFDLLPAAARASGFELLFRGVALRPGKPIVVGRRGGTLWFGLPGNPVSSAVDFHLFVRFTLDKMEGDRRPGAPVLTARLERDWKSAVTRETFRDAILANSPEGGLTVEPITTRGSHDLAAHSRANALMRLPAGSGPLAAGALVECLVIGEVGRPIARGIKR